LLSRRGAHINSKQNNAGHSAVRKVQCTLICSSYRGCGREYKKEADWWSNVKES
jgi:hypothetical protein